MLFVFDTVEVSFTLEWVGQNPEILYNRMIFVLTCLSVLLLCEHASHVMV